MSDEAKQQREDLIEQCARIAESYAICGHTVSRITADGIAEKIRELKGQSNDSNNSDSQSR